MNIENKTGIWILWLSLVVIMMIVFTYILLQSPDKTLFMPGPLSPGHHQLEGACEACHSDPLGGGAVLQEACIKCHGDDRKKPFDSHPQEKFTDPRNSDLLNNIDALQCVSCHTEHRPEITLKDGLTQPLDVCINCHADIAKERPSHKGMAFNTCKNSGCHNFHNNRALYTDFLIKHLHEPSMLDTQTLPRREFANILDELMTYPREQYPIKTLTKDDADAPIEKQQDPHIMNDWLATSHAQAGVNCSACHTQTKESIPTAWVDRPGYDNCEQCHNLEVERFQKGKHGMRLAVGLTEMTPEQAQLPMTQKSIDQQLHLNCGSCHAAHQFDTQQAAVEACLVCHNDQHSLSYKQSPHYLLWQKQVSGELASNSGVSCASCHMPRINYDVDDWVSRIMVDHNQSAALSPNSKMLRPVCLHCHGLQFSLDSLADKLLIEHNFKGKPSVHVDSLSLAEKDYQRAQQEIQNMGGDE